jgi:hypothetical protein
MEFSNDAAAVLHGNALAAGTAPDPQLEAAADPYRGVPLGVEAAWWPAVTGAPLRFNLS